MIALLLTHWIISLVTGGLFAALGVGGSALGWPVVLKYWKQILVTILLIVLLIVSVVLYVDLQRTRADEATYAANFKTIQSQAETVNADNQNLVKQLQAQSDSIKQAAQDGIAAQAQSKLALAAAMAKQAGDAKTIAALRARSANPATNKGTCDEELQFIRSGL